MKKMIASCLLFLFSANALATVDGHDRAYVVVKHIQSGEYFVERVPVIGCYGGFSKGPQLVQFTADYKVTSNIGCGGEVFHDNINYLTCATITDSKASADYMGFSDITLDISKCDDKNNPQLITMIRTAAKMNFPLKKGEVNLKIIK